jgi:hypothetical protein
VKDTTINDHKQQGGDRASVFTFSPYKTLSKPHGFEEKSNRNGAEGRKEASLQVFLFAFAVKNFSPFCRFLGAWKVNADALLLTG